MRFCYTLLGTSMKTTLSPFLLRLSYYCLVGKYQTHYRQAKCEEKLVPWKKLFGVSWKSEARVKSSL
jgi:hypothetical protein